MPKRKIPRIVPPGLLSDPTFKEYTTARKVVMFVVDELRREKFNGKLNIASDEMIARIVYRSCPLFNLSESLPDPFIDQRISLSPDEANSSSNRQK